MEPWTFDSEMTRMLILRYVAGVIPAPIYLPVARTDNDLRTTKMILRDTLYGDDNGF